MASLQRSRAASPCRAAVHDSSHKSFLHKHHYCTHAGHSENTPQGTDAAIFEVTAGDNHFPRQGSRSMTPHRIQSLISPPQRSTTSAQAPASSLPNWVAQRRSSTPPVNCFTPAPSHFTRVTSPLRRVASPIGAPVTTPSPIYPWKPIVENDDDEPSHGISGVSHSERGTSPFQRPLSPLPDPRQLRRAQPLALSIPASFTIFQPSPQSARSPILSALEEFEQALDAKQALLERAEQRSLALTNVAEETSHVRIDSGRIQCFENNPRAKGSYGEVWFCYMDITRQVAVKKIQLKPQDPFSSERLRAHLFREVKPWYTLSHPNISPFIGYVFDGESARMVSEWQLYGNVKAYLGRYPKTDRWKILLEIAEGLAYLHSCSVVHGDLKPANVLISAEKVAKLTDFGLSTVLEDPLFPGLRSSSNFRGTLLYADPSLLDNKPKTCSTDIYALGWLAYELLTGKEPYSHLGPRSHFNIVTAVVNRDLPRPTTDRIPYRRVLWPLLQACWNPSDASRWTASEVVSYISPL